VAAAPATQRVAAAAVTRRLSYKEQRELDGLPQRIQELEQEQGALASTIADPELYARDPPRAAAALARLETLARELERAYARWAELES
jgi:ATP-binding cassette subfamily F protein uup